MTPITKELRIKRMPLDLYQKLLLVQGLESARKGRLVNIEDALFRVIREFKPDMSMKNPVLKLK